MEKGCYLEDFIVGTDRHHLKRVTCSGLCVAVVFSRVFSGYHAGSIPALQRFCCSSSRRVLQRGSAALQYR